MIPNPNIYVQDEGDISHDLLPVKKRTKIHLAWLKELLSSAQWLHDLMFNDYTDGSLAPNWVSGSNYVYLDRVVFIDGAVYELQNTAGLTPSTITPNVDTANWNKVLDSFIGARERARYTGQKLMLEYILNRRFQVASFSLIEWEVKWIAGAPVVQSAPPYTQIYIKAINNPTNNFWLSNGSGLVSYMSNTSTAQRNYLGNAYSAFNPVQYNIYVPIALYTAIGAYQPAGVTADTAIRAVVDAHAACGSIYTISTY